MKRFLEDRLQETGPYMGYSIEDQLSIYYYDYLMKSKNLFLRTYMRFDFNMKNLLAAMNCRKYNSNCCHPDSQIRLHNLNIRLNPDFLAFLHHRYI